MQKKGRTCPYCKTQLYYDIHHKRWYCETCNDIDYEIMKVDTGWYR